MLKNLNSQTRLAHLYVFQEDLKACDLSKNSKAGLALLEALENVAYELIELIDDESLVSQIRSKVDYWNKLMNEKPNKVNLLSHPFFYIIFSYLFYPIFLFSQGTPPRVPSPSQEEKIRARDDDCDVSDSDSYSSPSPLPSDFDEGQGSRIQK